jgi:hypothetical protein
LSPAGKPEAKATIWLSRSRSGGGGPCLLINAQPPRPGVNLRLKKPRNLGGNGHQFMMNFDFLRPLIGSALVGSFFMAVGLVLIAEEYHAIAPGP